MDATLYLLLSFPANAVNNKAVVVIKLRPISGDVHRESLSRLANYWQTHATTSTKPEVHNVSICCQKDRATDTCRKFGEVWACGS